MLHVVLHQPEIPPNTGNVIRLCANTGAHLHLIEPMGFKLDDAKLRRAGLDYHEYTQLQVHRSFATFLELIKPQRWFAISTKGTKRFNEVSYEKNDALLFGSETRGLPSALLDTCSTDHVIRLPMQPNNRSLNLSNAVAVTVFEAWRQFNYCGAC